MTAFERRMNRLREDFAEVDEFHLPFPVALDRIDVLASELEHLVELMNSSSIPGSKRNKWASELANTDVGQSWGAWFEIKLFGWLQDIGDIEVGETKHANWDFELSVDPQVIIVEAYAYQKRELERRNDGIIADLNTAFDGLKLPYVLTVNVEEFGSGLDKERVRAAVADWLSNAPDEPFTFVEAHGTRITIEAQHLPDIHHAVVYSVGCPLTVESSHTLYGKLEDKAIQHKNALGSEAAYIIAVLLQPDALHIPEVHEALFGRSVYDSDLDVLRFDGHGVLLSNGGPRHEHVSGVLAFRAFWNQELQRNSISATYIPNPNANVPISEKLFPAELTRMGLPAKSIDSTVEEHKES